MEEKKTLRDEIAIAVANGAFSNSNIKNVSNEKIAQVAYRMADAMLKQSAKQPNTGE